VFEKLKTSFKTIMTHHPTETSNWSLRTNLFMSSCYMLLLITRLILEYYMNQLLSLITLKYFSMFNVPLASNHPTLRLPPGGSRNRNGVKVIVCQHVPIFNIQDVSQTNTFIKWCGDHTDVPVVSKLTYLNAQGFYPTNFH
jgi:hypothetical protein